MYIKITSVHDLFINDQHISDDSFLLRDLL